MRVLPPPPVDPDDQVSVPEFAVFWWADEAPREELGGSSAAFAEFLHRKESLTRMLRRSTRRSAFPEPAGRSGRTQLYRLGELVSWASASGGYVPDAVGDRTGAVSPLWHVRRALEAVRDETGHLGRRLAVAAVLVLGEHATEAGWAGSTAGLVAAEGAEGEWLVANLRRTGGRRGHLEGVADALVPDAPARVVSLRRLVPALSRALAAGYDAAGLADLARTHLADGEDRGTGSPLTASGLARLMLAVGDPRPGERVVDLAAGEGCLLTAVAEQTGGQAVLVGYEPEPAVWAIAMVRFALRGLAVDLRREPSLGGARHESGADLVLVDPPLAGRRSNAPWLELAAS